MVWAIGLDHAYFSHDPGCISVRFLFVGKGACSWVGGGHVVAVSGEELLSKGRVEATGLLLQH